MSFEDVVSKVADPYERPARLYPALLALLPLFVMMMLLYGPKASALSSSATIGASCGGLYLLTNLCREMGKRLEEKLYREWGGKPTTQLLRHRDSTIEAATKRRYHSFLAAKINQAFPDSAQEANDPGAADEVYQSGVRWLLNQTRPEEKKKFDLLLRENIAYGFRRNALGMRPIGLGTSICALLWTLVKEDVLLTAAGKFIDVRAIWRLPDAAIASLIVSGAMILVWSFFFTKASLRTAAVTYAEALLRACDIL
jgi:hypothetical protein